MNKQHFTETQRPEEEPLGILGGGVPPSPPNPISEQKILFFTPVFRPGLSEIMSSLLRLQQQQCNLFEFAYFFFFLTHLELKQ